LHSNLISTRNTILTGLLQWEKSHTTTFFILNNILFILKILNNPFSNSIIIKKK